MSKRETGVFSYVKVENYRGDGGPPNTVSIGIDFNGGGSHQGWGGLYLPSEKEQQVYLKMLCETFGVSKPEELKDVAVVALRSFEGWNEPIVGVENPKTGARFTTKKFRDAMGYPDPSVTVLQERRQSLRNRIARARQQEEDAVAELASINSKYTEWD